MFRGALYGTIGAALGLTVSADTDPVYWLITAVLAWLFFLLFGLAPLMVAAMAVQPIQARLRRVVSGRVFLPVAVLAAVPFGILLCFVGMNFFGSTDSLWKDLNWFIFLRVAIAGGLGLGFGCVHDVPNQH